MEFFDAVLLMLFVCFTAVNGRSLSSRSDSTSRSDDDSESILATLPPADCPRYLYPAPNVMCYVVATTVMGCQCTSPNNGEPLILMTGIDSKTLRVVEDGWEELACKQHPSGTGIVLSKAVACRMPKPKMCELTRNKLPSRLRPGHLKLGNQIRHHPVGAIIPMPDCKLGFTKYGGESQLVCTEDGTWEVRGEQNPACLACRVRKYDKHVSSAGTRKHVAVGSSMQVRCKPNYYTVGSVDVSCKVRNGSNSSHGFYVAEALFTTFPTCEDITCPISQIRDSGLELYKRQGGRFKVSNRTSPYRISTKELWVGCPSRRNARNLDGEDHFRLQQRSQRESQILGLVRVRCSRPLFGGDNPEFGEFIRVDHSPNIGEWHSLKSIRCHH